MKAVSMSLAAGLAAAILLAGAPALAQPTAAAQATRLGAERKSVETIRLYPGVAPGSESWKQVERTTPHMAGQGSRLTRNVVSPTLEVFLPDPAKATGAGVIIAPGGGMRFLSYDTEGVWVAQWLAEHGVAAFVLKYRTVETPAGDLEFLQSLQAMFAKLGASPTGAGPLEGADFATADGVRALQVAKERAKDWKVDPSRIGIMGFSAGARVTVGAVDAGAKPAFAAPIYGGAFGEPLKLDDAPPMFLAVSSDDKLASPTVIELFTKLQAAGKSPELHVYHTGGHGYGLEAKANSSAHWIDEFYWWLESAGFLKTR
ncbi:alpha/beta hydrolase [Phenylobacterium sp. LjRoot164]|uniref:alpha/beta hydrolase n=1 Tax=unclassified Phenylobacterium TaxID=2640670 RepID=UPI003ECC6ACA